MYMVENKDLDKALSRSKFGLKAIRIVIVFFIVSVLSGSVPFVFLIPADPSISLHDAILPAASCAIHAITQCGFLGILFIILTKVIRGESPFSFKYSKWLMVAGFLLLIDAAFNSITPGFFSYEFIGGDLPYGIYFEGVEPGTFDIDTENILLAVVVFALSAIFSYGALLQNLSDDLV